MIKTIITPQGCKNVKMTDQEVAARQEEEAINIAAQQAIEPAISVEDRLSTLESKLDDVINRGVVVAKQDMGAVK